MNGIELLKKCKIFDELSEDEKHLLTINFTKVQFRKNERIVKIGEFVKYLIFIEMGFVKVHSEFKGKPFIINVFGPKSFAGISSMIGRDKHEFDITALEDTSVLLIDISLIKSFIEKNGMFARVLIELLNESMLHYIRHNVVTLNQTHMHGRLANTLLYLSKNVFNSLNFDLLLSRKELSQFSNVSRENVIKVLYEFNTEGIIKLNGKHIQILNAEQLSRLADIC